MIITITGVRRFNARGKLSSKYIGPSEITETLNLVASSMSLSAELEHMYSVFCILLLKDVFQA